MIIPTEIIDTEGKRKNSREKGKHMEAKTLQSK
jgi:hypothetical protein